MNRRLVLLLIPFFVAAYGTTTAFADVILQWNRVASDVLRADTLRQNPGMASRTMAMMNLAMYDAVNGVQPRHRQVFSYHSA
ncbi:MAG: hypothetical protein AAF961_04130, partial [Planctomycetota bacterium]